MEILHDNRPLAKTEDNAQPVDVDDIFAQADKEMQQQWERRENYYRKSRNLVKKTKKTITTSIIISIILIVVILVSAVIIGIKTSIDSVKSTAYQQLVSTRQAIMEIPNEELTLDTYYLKRVMCVIDDNDLKNMVNNLISFTEIANMFDEEYLLQDDLLSPEKQQKVKDIFDEYAQKKTEELEKYEQQLISDYESQQNTIFNSEDISQDGISSEVENQPDVKETVNEES